MPRKPRANPAHVALESQIQETITQGLRLKGYLVLVTNPSRVFVRCRVCGTGSQPVFRGDPGVPDLLVTRKAWPPGLWLGLEVKRNAQARASSPEQKGLIDSGRVAVVWTWEQAIEACSAMDRLANQYETLASLLAKLPASPREADGPRIPEGPEVTK